MYFKLSEQKAREDIIDRMYVIEDLRKSKKNFNITPQRKMPFICVIDDNDFPCLTQVKNSGYEHIDVHYDFTKLSDYEKYDIILCDIADVGKNYSRKEQGLAIAKDLKKNYPFKKIFIYSGNISSDYGELPDDIKIIPKHYAPLEIINTLDSAASYLWNPIKAWTIIEIEMNKANLCNKNKAYIEDLFVRSILDGKNYFEKNNETTLLQIFANNKPVLDFAIKIIFGILGLLI